MNNSLAAGLPLNSRAMPVVSIELHSRISNAIDILRTEPVANFGLELRTNSGSTVAERILQLGSAQPTRRILIPRSRRLTLDCLYFHRQVDTCAHDRTFDLSRVVELRSQLPSRISWSVLFIKAFAIVAARRPILRQTFQTWPWPHICQHSDNVAMLAIHRELDHEPWVFHARFERPETQPLTHLQLGLNRYQNDPVKEIFHKQWQLSGLPTFIRRTLWWWTLNMAVSKRAHRIGTFFFTTLAGKGVEIQDPPAYFTSNLTYGPLDDHHRCRVTMSYDHRLMDGSFVADCLIELESVLNGEIASELKSLIDSSNVAFKSNPAA